MTIDDRAFSGTEYRATLSVGLFELMLRVPVKSFSVMSGRFLS